MNVSFSEILKFENVIGNNNNAEAKIAGITPAELILSGRCDSHHHKFYYLLVFWIIYWNFPQSSFHKYNKHNCNN